MFKKPKSRPLTWGRFRVNAVRTTHKPAKEQYGDYTGYKPDIDEDAAYEPFVEGMDKVGEKDTACIKTAYQRAIVSVPIAVKPYSVAGPTNTLCCSDPVITKVRWTGEPERICYFTITQEICVEVPVQFGAEAFAGAPGVKCLSASLDDCEDCLESDDAI